MKNIALKKVMENSKRHTIDIDDDICHQTDIKIENIIETDEEIIFPCGKVIKTNEVNEDE